MFSKNHYGMIATFVAVLVHSFWCWLFIVKMGLKYNGTGMANVLSQVTQLALLLIFTKCDGDERIREADSIEFDWQEVKANIN